MTKLENIVELKAQIDSAKTELTKLEGRKEAILAELKKDWGCTTIKQADTKASNMETERQKLIDKREKNIEKLEEKYEL